MSKRLICTERPLAALGREDVMKRVFFSLCREKPAAEGVVVGGRGFRGWTWPVGQLQHRAPLPHPSTQSLPLLLTASLERIVIYLVSHERGAAVYAAYGPEPSAGVMGGHGDIMRGLAQGPACCPRSAVCGDDQQATDVVLSLCSAV